MDDDLRSFFGLTAWWCGRAEEEAEEGAEEEAELEERGARGWEEEEEEVGE